MKNFLSLILLLFFWNFFLSQTIQFVSSNSGSPLPQVFIYDVSGKIITESDIDGKINVDQLKPFQEKYILYYENYKIRQVIRFERSLWWRKRNVSKPISY